MKKVLFAFILCLGILFVACQITYASRSTNESAFNLPKGYKIEVYAESLSVPTTAIFDGKDLIVAESGEADTAKPRILRITPEGKVTQIAGENLEPPVTGLLIVKGKLYVSHRTKVSVVEPGGKLKDIITGLPSNGDHQNDKMVLGKDGKIYIGQGTVTNSGVVGVDNYLFGWLKEYPKIHEIPCKDITLTGQNFTTDNPLGSGQVTTGAYHAFGQSSYPGEVIKGNPKCGGSIARFNPDGSDLELYAWGMRNPFGLAIDSAGQLWTNFHGADVRGSRPVFNDRDYLVKVEKDAWYGWPDYFVGKPVTDPSFNSPDGPAPQMLWDSHPELSLPFATYEPHSAANGLAFSPGGDFGYKGDGFSALFGTFTTPTAGINLLPNGFQIARVDMKTGKVSSFASNKIPGPSYVSQSGGFDRPSDVVFGPDSSLYVVDFGSSHLSAKGLELTPGTGVIWRIYKDSQRALRPNGPIVVSVAPQENRKPLVALNRELIKTQAPHILFLLMPVLAIIVAIIFWRKRS